MLFLKTIILGIIQGLTEFLPISSTGHMIIVEQYMALPATFRETFLVVVQLGSILSVLVYFRAKLFPAEALSSKAFRLKAAFLWSKVIVGVIPALIIGGLWGGDIKDKLYSTPTVAMALLAGGIILIGIEGMKLSVKYKDICTMPYTRAFCIGLAQCMAMIPGVSRSAATIIGALCLGASRELAVEYSFLLAIPTMFAASAYSLMKDGANMTPQQWLATGAGFITAFFVAWGVIAFFMSYIRKKDFKIFGWYRIALGIVLLVWLRFIG